MDSRILVDEIGYLPNDLKRAVYRGEGKPEFSVISVATGEEVYHGVAGMEIKCAAADETNRVLAFDDLKEEGEYYIQAGDAKSVTFAVKDWAYRDAMKALLKFFYLQRCGTDLPEEYAGVFAHPECHNTPARIYGTAMFKNVNGGWHDAGDFGRYIVPAAITVADLFLAIELDPDLTKLDFGADFYMPEEEKEELIISPVSYTATLDFAASLAMAVKYYKPYDEEYAKTLEEASKKAYDAALKMDVKGFRNPDGVVTGEYGDEVLEDELYWASAELFRAYGDEKYRKTFEEMAYKHISHGYGWEDVYSFGNVAYILSDYPVDETLKNIG